MMTKAYQTVTTICVTSLMLAMLVVAPVSAQSAPGMEQAQNQSSSGQMSPCLTTGQSASQATSQDATTTSDQTANQFPSIGSGVDNASAPLDCWVALGAHQSHWYKFRYGYNSDQDDTPDQATVKLAMDAAGCVSFEVWTQERLNAAQNGVTDDDKLLGPVGAGSPEYAAVERDSTSNKNQNPAKLIWVGSQTGSTTFYVVVKDRQDFACSYKLSISGFSVSFPSNTANKS